MSSGSNEGIVSLADLERELGATTAENGATSETKAGKKRGLSGGAKAGIAVGTIAGAGILAASLYAAFRPSSSPPPTPTPTPTPTPPPTPTPTSTLTPPTPTPTPTPPTGNLLPVTITSIENLDRAIRVTLTDPNPSDDGHFLFISINPVVEPPSVNVVQVPLVYFEDLELEDGGDPPVERTILITADDELVNGVRYDMSIQVRTPSEEGPTVGTDRFTIIPTFVAKTQGSTPLIYEQRALTVPVAPLEGGRRQMFRLLTQHTGLLDGIYDYNKDDLIEFTTGYSGGKNNQYVMTTYRSPTLSGVQLRNPEWIATREFIDVNVDADMRVGDVVIVEFLDTNTGDIYELNRSTENPATVTAVERPGAPLEFVILDLPRTIFDRRGVLLSERQTGERFLLEGDQVRLDTAGGAIILNIDNDSTPKHATQYRFAQNDRYLFVNISNGAVSVVFEPGQASLMRTRRIEEGPGERALYKLSEFSDQLDPEQEFFWTAEFLQWENRPVNDGTMGHSIMERTRPYSSNVAVDLSEAPFWEIDVSGMMGGLKRLNIPPHIWTVSMRCRFAQFGYAIGDEVDVSSYCDTAFRSVTTWANATQVGFRSNSAEGVLVTRRDAIGDAFIDDSNWELVFRAWPDTYVNAGRAPLPESAFDVVSFRHFLVTGNGEPRRPVFWRVCIRVRDDAGSGDQGYAAGDEVDITCFGNNHPDNWSQNTWADAENVYVRMNGLDTITVVPKAGGTSGLGRIVPAKWEYVFRVW